MSQKERQRYHLLKMVVEGKTTLKYASSVMGVSYRHGKRLKRKLVIEGARGLVHGNRGRPSGRAFHPELAKWIIELYQKTYTAFNDTHFTEKLNEVEGITVSRDTVRRLRRSNGIKPKRKRRAKKHYQRRPRKEQEGMMVLWDGSPHRWFSKDKPSCCLMAAIDDASSELLDAFFIPYECSFGYLKLLEHMVTDMVSRAPSIRTDMEAYTETTITGHWKNNSTASRTPPRWEGACNPLALLLSSLSHPRQRGVSSGSSGYFRIGLSPSWR